MEFKFITFLALFAIAAAGPLDHYHQQAYQQQNAYEQQATQHDYQPAQKVVAPQAYAKQQEYESGPVEYDFKYAVNDEHTGDVKTQQETRKGDNVVGQYTLIDADGYRRIVDYTSDEHTGFQAVVRREPIDGYKQPIAQKYLQTPVAQKYVKTPVESYKYEDDAVAQKYVQAPVAQNYVEAPKYQAPQYSAPTAKYVAPIANYVAPIQASKYAQPLAKYAQESAPVASQAQYEAYYKAQYEEAAPLNKYHY